MHVLRDFTLEEAPDNEEYDFHLEHPSQQFSASLNSIPLQGSVQTTRLFYGNRFDSQAVAHVHGEQPLVQNLDTSDPKGRSFDEINGEHAGIRRAPHDGEVTEVTPHYIAVRGPAGISKVDIFHHHPSNQKSGVNSRPVVKPGDKVTAGTLLAATNFTDDEGVLNMGTNALVGLVPHRGHTKDDALEVSQAYADKMTSEHYKTLVHEAGNGRKHDLNHYRSIFPTAYDQKLLQNYDSQGIIKPGTIVSPNQPLALTTSPRVMSSKGAGVNRLTRAHREGRRDDSLIWDGRDDAEVIDSRMTKDGVKVFLRYASPLRPGDKICGRPGAKGTVARIIPTDQMPRTGDGKPLDLLLNPLSLFSRANPSTAHEMRLGKIAEKLGHPLKLPSYLPKGQNWNDYIDALEQEHGTKSLETIFDPEAGRALDQPVAVGRVYFKKLHHVSACYDDQTEVLTQRGWLRWADVTMLDELATSDVRGQKLFFERPLHLVSYDYKGDLCAYKGRYANYAVTPNHNMWSKLYHTTGDLYSLKQASALHGKRFKIRTGHFDVTDPGSPEFFDIGTHHIAWEDFCEFVGWWVTEGCVGSSKVCVVVYQSSTANPDKFERIEQLIRRMGVRWSYYKAGGVKMGFHVLEKSFADYFANYGGHSQDKAVPREFITGSHAGCRRLLEAINLGDGSYCGYWSKGKPTGHYRLSVTSRQLVDDYQEMAVRVGWGSSVTYESNDSVKAINPHYLTQHRASISTTRRCAQVDGDRHEDGFCHMPYEGKVYCAEMRTGLLFVRRNGKTMLCGNSKLSSRGTGGYDNSEQPMKGGFESAQAKRFSGLENVATMSSGAYAVMRENATIKGQKNDEYHRALRSAQPLPKVGEPFVWHKFRHLLAGAGIRTKDMGGGRIRLAPMTDKHLDSLQPVDVKHGGTIDIRTFEPEPDGLFDSRISNHDRWGRIKLPRPVVNPAYEDSVRTLLGLTRDKMEAVLAGKIDMAGNPVDLPAAPL